ncbi:MAG: hypothetical protein K0S53_2832 [Bacteroidetes bacterium]|jgi:hypothetical protein|nr:hypothetical protein [Bacteroidota bacterium]
MINDKLCKTDVILYGLKFLHKIKFHWAKKIGRSTSKLAQLGHLTLILFLYKTVLLLNRINYASGARKRNQISKFSFEFSK